MARQLNFSYNGTPLAIDFGTILNTEAIEVEKVTGKDYMEWMGALDDADIPSITALYWIALKRTGQDIAYRDVSFPVSEWGGREWSTDETDEGAEVDPQTPGDEAGSEEVAPA